ncbi:MAG: PIN domain-containing protein [Selenomonadaceae bacterium]|nr:PIN domain-containing protein [Selenomonadaceae bacterium]
MNNKNIKVLIDTNVAMTFLTKREDPYIKETDEIMYACASEKIIGFLAFHSLSTIWYLGRKFGEAKGREMLETVCDLLYIVGASQKEVEDAVQNKQFKDFEDCLQDKCAKEANCDFIVTANLKDFTVSEIPAISPDEFLKILKDYLGSEVEDDEQT